LDVCTLHKIKPNLKTGSYCDVVKIMAVIFLQNWPKPGNHKIPKNAKCKKKNLKRQQSANLITSSPQKFSANKHLEID